MRNKQDDIVKKATVLALKHYIENEQKQAQPDEKKTAPSAGVIYAPDGKPAAEFKNFTRIALCRKTDMWIETAKLPTLIEELRAEHQRVYSQPEIEKIASQVGKAFTFTCRNCGKLESDAVLAGAAAKGMQAMNPRMAAISHGSKMFNLFKGRCPGCGNESVHVSYDPCRIQGVSPLSGSSGDEDSQFRYREGVFEKLNVVAPGKSPAHLRLQAIYDSMRKRPMGCGVFVVGILCWIGAFVICFGLIAVIINLTEMMKIADSPAMEFFAPVLGIIALVLPFVALILCTRRYSKNNATKRSRETESLINMFVADFPAEFTEFFSEDRSQILNLKKLANAIDALRDIQNLSHRQSIDYGEYEKSAGDAGPDCSAEDVAGQQLLLQIRLTHAKIARLNREVKATLGCGSTILICVLFVLYLFAGIILATCATVTIFGARDNPIAGLITIVLTLVIAIIATRFHIRRRKKKQQSALSKAEAELHVSVQDMQTKFPEWAAAIGGKKKLLNPHTVPEKFGHIPQPHAGSDQSTPSDAAVVSPPPIPDTVRSKINAFKRLAACDDPEATIEALLKMMNCDSDPMVRVAAQDKLVRLLIQAFSDKDGIRWRVDKQKGNPAPSVQQLSLKTAARFADSRLVEPLLGILDEYLRNSRRGFWGDPYIASDAISALAKQKDKRAVPMLVEIAQKSSTLGPEAGKAINEIGDDEGIRGAVAAEVLHSDPDTNRMIEEVCNFKVLPIIHEGDLYDEKQDEEYWNFKKRHDDLWRRLKDTQDPQIAWLLIQKFDEYHRTSGHHDEEIVSRLSSLGKMASAPLKQAVAENVYGVSYVELLRRVIADIEGA